MQITDGIFLAFNLVAIYLSVIWIVIYLSNKKNIFKNPIVKKLPSVTVIVPAYNEEENIGKCLNAVKKLDYPKNKLKIIAVNDGSTDRTADIVKKIKGVRLINKKNGGKASAMNYGMKFIDTDLVVCMDADSFPTKNYLKKAVGYFKDPEVAAVSTAVKIKEVSTISSKIQWVEYLISVVFRKLFSILDCQFVVPGAGGIYRAATVKDVGGFDSKSLTEDMEMTLRLQTKGYKIENCLDGYVYTECPKNFKNLFKQRMRWYRGYIENFKKYFHVFLNPKYGNFGVFFMPMTIVWIFIIVTMLLIQIGTFAYDSVNGLILWSLINYAIVFPDISISLFKIDSLTLALYISLITGLFLSWIGIKTGGIDKIKGRKIFYIIYFLVYPILFAFFWLCAIILDLLKVKKRW